MIRKHPVSILLLSVLTLCVINASLAALSPATKSAVSAVERVQEGLEEASEASPGTPPGYQITEPYVLSNCEKDRYLARPAYARRTEPVFCSIGWLLPLRL